jgi:DNA-binding MarR family transcriptional regulator
MEPLAVANALKRAQHEFRLALNAELASLRTNSSQLSVLGEIRANPGASSAQLARLCSLTPQALGEQVMHLQARGLIERSPGPGRRIEHRLTSAGEQLLVDGLARANAVHERVLEDFGDDELEALGASFRKIARRAAETRRRIVV